MTFKIEKLFKADLGKALVGKEDFDMNRFVTDPAMIGNEAFKTESRIKDLIQLKLKEKPTFAITFETSKSCRRGWPY